MLSGTHLNSRQEQVVYGRPACEALIELAAQYGAQRLLITTTRSLAGPGGLATRLGQQLGALCVGSYAGISAHSPREAVLEGAEQARSSACDLLVAVGGGSVIDATKVMQLCIWCGVETNEQLAMCRVGRGSARRDVASAQPTLRMVAIPTTLSAAEFTAFAGVTDRQAHAKEGYYHAALAPRAVVLDPACTVETPAELWCSTGMKAVDHAVEQLCHPQRAPYADALAAEGLRRLAAGLLASSAAPSDLAARLECQFGMWLAISGASAGRGIGASHAIGHTLGGMCGVPHGLTSCVTLPAVLRWNESVDAERQALVRALLGATQLSAADTVKALCQRLALPTAIERVGVAREQFRAIAEHTMHDRGVRGNPRPIRTPDDIVEILELSVGDR